jgi:hypothetical protein
MPISASTTAYGRDMIEFTKAAVEKEYEGANVIYGTLHTCVFSPLPAGTNWIAIALRQLLLTVVSSSMHSSDDR